MEQQPVHADVSIWSFNPLDTAGLLFSLSDNNGIDLLRGEKTGQNSLIKKRKSSNSIVWQEKY